MLVERYDPEDVGARVPARGGTNGSISCWRMTCCISRCGRTWGSAIATRGSHGRHSTPVEVILRRLLCRAPVWMEPTQETTERVADSVRVLSRLVKRAKPLVARQLQQVGSACRSRLRSARQAAQQLHRLLRRKSEEKLEQQRALYQKLIETRSRVLEGKKVASADKVLSLFEPHARHPAKHPAAPRSSLGGTSSRVRWTGAW